MKNGITGIRRKTKRNGGRVAVFLSLVLLLSIFGSMGTPAALAADDPGSLTVD